MIWQYCRLRPPPAKPGTQTGAPSELAILSARPGFFNSQFRVYPEAATETLQRELRRTRQIVEFPSAVGLDRIDSLDAVVRYLEQPVTGIHELAADRQVPAIADCNDVRGKLLARLQQEMRQHLE